MGQLLQGSRCGTVGAGKAALQVVAAGPVQQRLRAVRVQLQHARVARDGCVQLARALQRAGQLEGGLRVLRLKAAGLPVICQRLVYLPLPHQGRGSDEVRPQQHARGGGGGLRDPFGAGPNEALKGRVGNQVPRAAAGPLLLAPPGQGGGGQPVQLVPGARLDSGH